MNANTKIITASALHLYLSLGSRASCTLYWDSLAQFPKQVEAILCGARSRRIVRERTM